MKFTISSEKFAGHPDPSGWVTLHDFTPASDDKFLSKGRLLAVLSMLPVNDFKLADKEDLVVSREILTRLHEEYFGKEGSTFSLLNTAVQVVQKEFTSLNTSLHIATAVILDDKIYFAAFGNMDVWIVRGDKLAKILPNPKNSASGNLQQGDKFFLGSSTFFAKITPDLLKSHTNLASLIPSPEPTDGAFSLKIDTSVQEQPQPVNITLPKSPPPPLGPKPISPIRLALASGIDKILIHLPHKKIFVKEDLPHITETSKRKKVATFAGLILLFLLLVSIFFGIRQQQLTTSRSKYEGVLASAQHNLDEARGLTSIDASRARQLILDAKTQTQTLIDQGVKDAKLDTLLADIKNALGQVGGIYEGDPQSYLDLSLLSSGFKGDDMVVSEARLVVLDKSGKRLVSIDLDTKKTEVVAGPDIMPNANFVAAYSDRNFVSASDGIWDIGAKADIVIKPEWGTNILPFAYTGNFYILDKDNSTVWRYQGDGGVFLPKQNWFGAGTKPDLANVISWTIDGNIWMLTKGGEILRFAQGSPVNFALKDLDKDLKANDIYTDTDSKFLYILDAGNERVLVVDKDGAYKAQYVAKQIKDMKKMIVSETTKKIILLNTDKLYSLDIKHLD